MNSQIVSKIIEQLQKLPEHPGLAGDFDDKTWIDKADLNVLIREWERKQL